MAEEKQIPDQNNLSKSSENIKPISDKILLFVIGLIVLIIASLFTLHYLIPKQNPITLDTLLQMNAEGKLKPDQGYMYKDVYSFVIYDGLWFTRLVHNGIPSDIRTHYSPRDLENISIFGKLNDSVFNNNTFYYSTFNPIASAENMKYVALSVTEYGIHYKRDFSKIPKASCIINETDACKNISIITCENTKEPVVYFKDEDPAKVIFQDNCIILQGQGKELVRATDRLLFSLYGIMQ